MASEKLYQNTLIEKKIFYVATPFILKQETSCKSLIHFFSQTELSNFLK